MSAAKIRVARFALPLTAVAFLASAISAVLGGPRIIGLFLLVASAIAGALTVLAARRARVISEDVVAELDRAAHLDGSLRSAHWFAGGSEPVLHPDRSAVWIVFHLEDAASRAARVNWTRVYTPGSTPVRWVPALACALATVGLFVWSPPRLLTRSIRPVDAARGAEPIAPSLSPSILPKLAEGIRAMKSGRALSREELSAIGHALEIAKNDPAVLKEIASASSADFNNGFELADLDWAYQEAVAQVSMDERAHPDPGAEAASSEGARDGKAVQVVGFSSLLFGKQQATGEADPAAAQQAAESAVTLAATLRHEIVHAQTDVPASNLDTVSTRRATNAGGTAAGAAMMENGVRYDRSRAAQPPALPEARRPLVHSFFLRPDKTH